jgi:hypothetical protein
LPLHSVFARCARRIRACSSNDAGGVANTTAAAAAAAAVAAAAPVRCGSSRRSCSISSVVESPPCTLVVGDSDSERDNNLAELIRSVRVSKN